MRFPRSRWSLRAGLAGGAALLVFAALASVGAAVSPSGSPAASAQYGNKVTICHRTGSKKNPFHTIRVSRNAVKAHLRHGDALGPCSTALFTMCDKARGKDKASKTIKVKGARAAAKHLRQGDKLRKCTPSELKAKGKHKGKSSEKQNGKKKGEAEREKHKPEKGGKKG
jgi:hypothetical protein